LHSGLLSGTRNPRTELPRTRTKSWPPSESKGRFGQNLCIFSSRLWIVSGAKVVGKSLPRLETLQSTPPFLQLYFLRRLKTGEIYRNSLIIIGKAFCGNGFIHLNIAEFYEGNIGGQKTCAYFGNQGSKWANWLLVWILVLIF